MHRNQTSQKSPTEHLTKPLHRLHQRRGKGAPCSPGIHVNDNEKNEFQFRCVESWWFLYCFSLGYFVGLTHSLPHTPLFFGCFKTEILRRKKGPKSHDLMVKFLDPQPSGEHRKGPRFPVFFFHVFFGWRWVDEVFPSNSKLSKALRFFIWKKLEVWKKQKVLKLEEEWKFR